MASGVALDALVVGLFGLGHETDAYFAALAIPFLIASIMESEAPKILVPFFAQGFEAKGRRDTWVQLRTLMAVGALLLFALVAAIIAGAWLLIPLQVPGLSRETVALAVQLQMILAWTVLTQGLSAVVSGALYADHHYLATTTSRLTTNVITIAVAALGHRRFGIRALAMGLLAGSCVQLVCVLGVAGLRGFRFGRAKLRDPSVTRLLRLSTYALLGQVLNGTSVFLENFLGSLLGAGALSAVRYANRVVGAVAGVLMQGLITTSLPILSYYAAGARFEEMKEALLKGIRFVALLALPVGLWLIFAGEPMIALAFERGRFTGADTARLGLLLALLAPYILFSRVASVAEVAFYATMDMRTPLWSVPAYLLSYVLVCWLLLRSLGVFAFAVATSFAAVIAAMVMVRLVERRFGALPWAGSREFGRRLAIVAATSILGFLVGSATNLLIADAGPLAKAVRLAIVTVSGLTAFLGSALFVRLVNWRRLLHVVRHTGPTTTAAGAPV